MAQTLRTYWSTSAAGHGRIRKNVTWPAITRKSVVVITASEAEALRQQLGDPLDAVFRHLGDANVWVSNVSPHDGGVEFILHVDWPNSLNVVVDITVLDSAVSFLNV